MPWWSFTTVLLKDTNKIGLDETFMFTTIQGGSSFFKIRSIFKGRKAPPRH